MHHIANAVLDTAYHFTSAATLILRCALEADNDDTARDCVSQASLLIASLRQAKDKFKWDLADICLTNCEAVVAKMSDGDYLDFRRRNPQAVRAEKGRTTGPENKKQTTRVRVVNPVSGQGLEGVGSSFEPPVIDNTAEQPVIFNCGEHLNTIFDGDNAGLYGDGIGMMPDSPYFTDLWQMPHIDGYGNF